MAETVGAVTGVLGACDVILRGTKSVHGFISNMKDAPNDRQRLSTEIQSLEAIVIALHAYLSSPKMAQSPLPATSPIAAALAQCQSFIQKTRLDFQESAGKSRVLWAMTSKEKYNDTLQQLQRFVSIFHVALSVFGWQTMSLSSEDAFEKLDLVERNTKEILSVVRPMDKMRLGVERLEAHLDTIRTIASLCVNDESEKILKRIDDNLQTQEDERDLAEFLGQLSSVDFYSRHADIAATRHKHTALWILQETEFLQWKDGAPSSALWCHGIPGCGKTILFSAIVDELERQEPKSDFITAAVYLTYQDPQLHNVNSILRALLRVFLGKVYHRSGNKDQVTAFKRRYNSRKAECATAEECMELMVAMMGPEKHIILCFDGWDEIPRTSRKHLLRLLDGLALTQKVKCLFTSRYAGGIRKGMPHREVVVSAHISDMKKFLYAKVSVILEDIMGTEPKKTLAKLVNQVVHHIIHKSQGMFLLAALQLRQLESSASVREMFALLDKIPLDIDLQFAAYLDRVKLHPRSDLALRAIRWLGCAYRPLTSQELLEALTIQPDDLDQDPMAMVKLDVVIEACGGLVHHDQNSGVVRLVHASLKDFISRKGEQYLGSPHSQILNTLSTFLGFNVFNKPRNSFSTVNWLEVDIIGQKYRLLDYACCQWKYHFDKGGPADMSTASRIVTSISKSHILIKFVERVGIPWIPLFDLREATPLHVAIAWGCHLLSAHLISQLDLTTLNAKSRNGQTPLHICAIRNDGETAANLLRRGADETIGDSNKRLPHHLAAICGGTAVLGAVLKHAAFRSKNMAVDILDQNDMTALQLALDNNQPECVKLLLDAGAAARSTGSAPPIHLAARACPSMFTTLLEKGASLEDFDSRGRSVLHALGIATHLDPGVLTLCTALDPDVSDWEGRRPLHVVASASAPDLGYARWLLDAGADQDAQNRDGETPLHVALQRGHFGLAGELLSRGAAKDAEARDGTLPVLLAVSQRDCPEDIVQTLLAVKTDFLIHRAVKRQNPDEVEGLIRRGQEINAQNLEGQTPLHIAVELFQDNSRHSSINKQRSNIVSLLLHDGANPMIESQQGLTPIHLAVLRDSHKLLSMLLRHADGIGVGLPGGESVLVWAGKHSSMACYELLVRKACEAQPALVHSALLRTLMDFMERNECLTPSLPSKLGDWSLFPLENGKYVCCHKLTCADFRTLLSKISLTTSLRGVNGELIALEPEFSNTRQSWLKLLQVPSLQRADISSIIATQCMMALFQVCVDLESPTEISTEPGSATESYVWNDDMPLKMQVQFSATYNKFRSQSELPALDGLGEIRRPTIANYKLRPRDLSVYDRTRRQPPTTGATFPDNRWAESLLQIGRLNVLGSSSSTGGDPSGLISKEKKLDSTPA